MKSIPILLLGFVAWSLAAQNYSYSEFNFRSQNVTNVNINTDSYYWGVRLAVNAFMKHETALAMISTIQKEYESHPTKPDSITKGWHNVIVTDNSNFCRDAKVYVSNNRIKEFVIDNYLPLDFKSTGIIRKAKNVITLSKSKNETVVIDTYFIYDLDEPMIADPPIEPGCVCFWTSNKKYLSERIIIENSKYDGVSKIILKTPECFEDGTCTIFLKPKTYKFTAQKSGNDYESSMIIKAGECLKYRLN